MKYGIYVPNFGEFGDARVLADLARDAEAADWDGFFIWDHIWPFLSEKPLWRDRTTVLSLPPQPLADAWIALTGIAMSTERIRFGALVTPLARRRPHKVAREAVTLDHLSGGRLVVGAGLGTPPDSEFERFGEESDDRVRAAKLDEALDVLTGLWSGRPFAHKGAYYTVRGATFLPSPLQRPRIPIWAAGIWPHKAPMRRAARFDGVFPQHVYFESNVLHPDDYRALRACIADYRTSDAPFDIVHYAGNNPAREPGEIARYEETGVTWWLEAYETTVAQARSRIRLGPPSSE